MFDITRKFSLISGCSWIFSIGKIVLFKHLRSLLVLPSLMQQDFEGLMTDAAARYQSQAVLGKLSVRTLQLMNKIQGKNYPGCILMYETTSNISDKKWDKYQLVEDFV